MSANVGFCSTYSIFTRSGPQTKIAYVFGRVDDVGHLHARLLGLAESFLRRVHEHRKVVEKRPLGIARLAVVELDERAADLDPLLTVRGEAELLVLPRRLVRARGEERHVVEVVLDVGLRLDEPEPKALLHVEICRAVLAVDRDPLEPPERLPRGR